MKKRIVLFIILIAILAVLAMSLNSFFRESSSDRPKILNNNSMNKDIGIRQDSIDLYEECQKNYNIPNSSIIFYNANDIHSNNMKPIVEDLEKTYDFYWKNTTSDSQFNACFGYYEPTIPAFVCAGTKQHLIGEVSKTKLTELAASCK